MLLKKEIRPPKRGRTANCLLWYCAPRGTGTMACLTWVTRTDRMQHIMQEQHVLRLQPWHVYDTPYSDSPDSPARPFGLAACSFCLALRSAPWRLAYDHGSTNPPNAAPHLTRLVQICPPQSVPIIGRQLEAWPPGHLRSASRQLDDDDARTTIRSL